MLKMPDSFNFKSILAGGASFTKEQLTFLENLVFDGYDRLIGDANQYCYPHYVYALREGEEVPEHFRTIPRFFETEIPGI